ncbi:kinase-like domain-containing protein [Thamnocephalis sphaerospora]|uniref:Kinase-like domain-containing protein n=1 Tax=Thamnocephalis sphaerospora TaxID=78915 RepID=A0A4P9XL40_9FUNG|nr:kinase-like domain-containing protein [Thamnocephalis sphaerospora]|eukprot:RKP06557.1 kinase-like domain-containing protein [Thamnocephalis sphaerospora]
MRTATVIYDSADGLLKCTPHVNQHDNEVNALTLLGDMFKTSKIRAVPTVLTTFKTNDGYHCLVTEVFKGYSLREYMSLLPERLRDVVAPRFSHFLAEAIYSVHTSGITYGNITPDTIYIQPKENFGEFRMILTSFEGSQALSDPSNGWEWPPKPELPRPSIVKPRGYCPPEDYTKSKVDQRMRDSWMLGATVYFMTNGHSPYGFAYSESQKAMIPVPEEELQKTMEQVMHTGKNSCRPMKTKNAALIKGTMQLMEPQALGRSKVGAFARDSASTLASLTRKKVFETLWNYLKSKMPIVGTPSWQVEPPEHVEDTTTRYKRP